MSVPADDRPEGGVGPGRSSLTQPCDPNDVPLALLTVHAHPDDEASKGSALVAKYVALGVRATLVCCTGGELGSVLNPAMDREEVHADLAGVRRRELERSAQIIGFSDVDLLGYRDSGMPDMEENHDPSNFWNAPLNEATARLVASIRRARPQVMITYGDDQGGYPHPDHLKVHTVSVEAFDRAADESYRPDLGAAWQASKLYYSVWSRRRGLALHERMVELGVESPFTPEWLDRFNQDERITTSVDVGEFMEVRDASLRAHATQVDPNEAFWFGINPREQARAYRWDDYILARSLVDTDLPEDDLFAGIVASW
ncbi:MAG: mycothiol conjugate amidase Mca [Microthrixaceae bacterium]